MSLHIVQLDHDPQAPFPPVELALVEPDGLLAYGGDLSPTRFLNAYRGGIFPWFSEGEPILWWSPSRRAVFRTDGVRLPSRLRRKLRGSDWVVRADTAFAQVVAGCAAPRAGQSGGTWITADMQTAYNALHALGHAHSIEVFDGEQLIGGVFGLSFGHMFCGDSMYSAESGASSLALAALAMRLRDWGWPIIDAQVPNAHTRSLGVETWRREDYLQALAAVRDAPALPGNWTGRFGDLATTAVVASLPA
ncbi:leucyl/phenylalanyl-tRNA--protein transferase [Thermomonas sp. HDW16]|uniref:leucyl/phenylalanyl-tRNA--protein transferase n=1 Tax=Thermomonas sp. HDW16 TaxID=2714945 RepID=UPI00140E2F2E|nr:leucyl/phenylalanyl-tRNA--protein transferase [Thermomonas sp. HDW16]QIL20637.1 leucyl/phenylalanyl-tRNA--protein transferase [Thermomonas sp. HDW16]